MSPSLNKKDPLRMKDTIRVFNCGSGRLSGVPSVPFISEKLRVISGNAQDDNHERGALDEIPLPQKQQE